MDSYLTYNGTNLTESPTSGSGTPPGKTVTVKVCLIVIAVVAVFGNGMVVFFIATKRRLRSKTNFMVASLAISDILVATVIIPSFLACMYVKCDDQLSKLFYDAFLFISVCNLCCITFDRFLAVTRPLRYHMKMTRRKVVIMVVVSWIVPTIVSLIPVAWLYTETGADKVNMNNKIFYTAQVVVFMFFPCLIMFVAYAVIFKIAWKQSRHITHVLRSLNNTNRTTLRPVPPNSVLEAKATLKVFGTVVLMFVFCWSLSAFRTIVVNYKLLDLPGDLVIASRIIIVANSAINPIIYALWKKDIKTEIGRLLKINSRMIRPSSGTFRSSQDLRYFDTSNADNSRRSRVGSVQDVNLAQLRTSDKPVNGVIHVPVADDSESEVRQVKTPELTPPTLRQDRVNEKVDVNSNTDGGDKPETEKQSTPTQTPSKIECGIVNMVGEVDGLV